MKITGTIMFIGLTYKLWERIKYLIALSLIITRILEFTRQVVTSVSRSVVVFLIKGMLRFSLLTKYTVHLSIWQVVFNLTNFSQPGVPGGGGTETWGWQTFFMVRIKGVFRGGGFGAQTPWISEIYGFQAVNRPQWVLSPTHRPPEKKIKPYQDKFLTTPLIRIVLFNMFLLLLLKLFTKDCYCLLVYYLLYSLFSLFYPVV